MIHKLKARLIRTFGKNQNSLLPGKKFKANLKRAAPELFWFRNSHYQAGDKLVVKASIASRDAPITSATVSANINGKAVDVEFSEASPQFKDAFWYLPEEHITDIVIRTDLPNWPSSETGVLNSDYLTVTLNSSHFNPDSATRTFMVAPDYKNFAVAPPVSNIERVSGKGATSYNYWNNGRTDFHRFSEIALKHDVNVTEPTTRILDWGCGCARLTRHWLALDNGADRVMGVDIDPINIQWCRDNLADAEFGVCPLVPPVDFGGNFDLVVGNSVVTHLKLDILREWLAALSSEMAEGGLALLSYHGDFSLASICSRNQEFWEKIQRSGFDASIAANELNDAISDPEYYRQTFMTDDFARSVFEAYFDIEAVYVGVVSRYQNVAALRKRNSR